MRRQKVNLNINTTATVHFYRMGYQPVECSSACYLLSTDLANYKMSVARLDMDLLTISTLVNYDQLTGTGRSEERRVGKEC